MTARLVGLIPSWRRPPSRLDPRPGDDHRPRQRALEVDLEHEGSTRAVRARVLVRDRGRVLSMLLGHPVEAEEAR